MRRGGVQRGRGSEEGRPQIPHLSTASVLFDQLDAQLQLSLCWSAMAVGCEGRASSTTADAAVDTSHHRDPHGPVKQHLS